MKETFFVYKFFFSTDGALLFIFLFILQSTPFPFLVLAQQNDENRRLHGNIVRVKCSIKLNVAENATLFVESVCEMHRERSSRVSWPGSGQIVMETEKEERGAFYKIVPRISTSLCCSAFLNAGISSGYLTNFTLIHRLDFHVALPSLLFFLHFIYFLLSSFRKLGKSMKRLHRLNIVRTSFLSILDCCAWMLLRLFTSLLSSTYGLQ